MFIRFVSTKTKQLIFNIMSKTSKDYQDLLIKLISIKTLHDAKGNKGLDATFISVVADGMGWREAKKMGFRKDYYYGWILYSTSTNSNGYNLYENIKLACEGFNVRVSERQL